MLNDFDTIYLDFDGTITKADSVNKFFNTFCPDDWLEIEEDWIDGKITSKECMKLELSLIKTLTEKKLDDFISSVELQDGFIEFCTFLKEAGKKIVILSDGFDLFISKTLKNNNLSYIKFFANKLILKEENGFLSLSLEFPNENKNCTPGLGMCKCSKISDDITKGKKIIFAGDGLSDRCIAKKANLVFAKNRLRDHCLEAGLDFVEFENFFDIKACLEDCLKRSHLRKDWQNAKCKAGFKTQ